MAPLTQRSIYSVFFDGPNRYPVNSANGGSATIGATPDGAVVNRGTSANGMAGIFVPGGGDEIFKGNPGIQFINPKIDQGASQQFAAWYVLGTLGHAANAINPLAPHIGFKFVNTGSGLELWVTCADGTTQNEIQITNLSYVPNLYINRNNYYAEINNGQASWYVNGVEVETTNQNVPTPSGNPTHLAQLRIVGSGGNSNQSALLGGIAYSKDILY